MYRTNIMCEELVTVSLGYWTSSFEHSMIHTILCCSLSYTKTPLLSQSLSQYVKILHMPTHLLFLFFSPSHAYLLSLAYCLFPSSFLFSSEDTFSAGAGDGSLMNRPHFQHAPCTHVPLDVPSEVLWHGTFSSLKPRLWKPQWQHRQPMVIE